MSMKTLESELAARLRVILNNPKLRVKDLIAWQCGTGWTYEPPYDDEVLVFEPYLSITCLIKKSVDKRKGGRQ